MIIPFHNHSVDHRKPTFRKRGQVITNVSEQLRERSGGRCERCYNAPATEEAHSVDGQLAVEDLIHLCPKCLHYCKTTYAGSIFLDQFRQIRLKEVSQ